MDIGWKVVSGVGGVVAGFLAKQIIEKSWQFATGKDTPDEDDFSANLVEIVAFSVIAGATQQVIRNLVMRQAANIYSRGSSSVATGTA
ncbi:MAG: DUF4235 domain-containing protein [Flaviflexus sp.]|nr:DUF4235 domain-containing protein [Flaviflexus sp.]